ncbi:Lactation elevated protein 1 [Hordeum vulgare]|nr:Lactation elevated protein 1 [Hordeum vulgare]
MRFSDGQREVAVLLLAGRRFLAGQEELAASPLACRGFLAGQEDLAPATDVGPKRQGGGSVAQKDGWKSYPANSSPIAPARAAPRMPVDDYVAAASNVFDKMGTSYKDMEAACERSFNLEHCWKLLQHIQKWELIGKESPPKRGSLTEMDDDDDENDDVTRNKNKPDGNKKAKINRESEPSSLHDKIDTMMQSNELMVVKTLEAKKELAEKKAQGKQEKWQLIKEEGLRKAAIEEKRALAVGNKALAKILAEENNIMTMNCNEMDDVTKEWHDMERREIFKRRMIRQVGWLPCRWGNGW